MKENCEKDCGRLYQSMRQLRLKIDQLNSLTGVVMFVKFGSDSLVVAACLCALAAGGVNKTIAACLFCFVVTSMADIVINCRSSQLIIESMATLCKTIDNHIASHDMSDYDYRQLNLIFRMKRSFRYQVLNLFELKDVTILVIIGYVTNYAVILVQTQNI